MYIYICLFLKEKRNSVSWVNSVVSHQLAAWQAAPYCR